MADGQLFIGSLHPYEAAIARLGIQQALPDNAVSLSDAHLRLGGVIPFCRGQEWHFCFMRPVAKHAHLPPPELQICKGTRLRRSPDGWRDVTLADLPLVAAEAEPLAVTALREGEEEIGLPPERILGLWDAGCHVFQAQSGNIKEMALFFAEVPGPEDFLPPDRLRAATEEVRWLTEAEALSGLRKEHALLLPPMLRALRRVTAIS